MDRGLLLSPLLSDRCLKFCVSPRRTGQKLKSDKRARNLLHRRLRELKRNREREVDGGHVSYSKGKKKKSPPEN